MTLTFNHLLAMVTTYSFVKLQGQPSVGSEDIVETNGQTNGQTDEGDCITSLATDRLSVDGEVVDAFKR